MGNFKWEFIEDSLKHKGNGSKGGTIVESFIIML